MSDKLQKEIEDLLASLDTFPPPKPRWKKARDAVLGFLAGIGHAITSIRFPSLNPGHLLLAAIIIIVGAWLLGGTTDLARWIIVAGVGLFILAFILSLRRHSPNRPPGGQKYWRDRPMDFSEPNPGDRVRSWWDRWRTRR
jgi:hypothetical protein